MMKKKSTDWSVDVDKTGSSRISNLFPPKRIIGARKERVLGKKRCPAALTVHNENNIEGKIIIVIVQFYGIVQ